VKYRILTLQWSVHAAHLIEACVPLTADDLWQNSNISTATRNVRHILLQTWSKPKAQKQQMSAATNQGLAFLSPLPPPVHKHRVDLIAIAGHKLVPLAIKL